MSYHIIPSFQKLYVKQKWPDGSITRRLVIAWEIDGDDGLPFPVLANVPLEPTDGPYCIVDEFENRV